MKGGEFSKVKSPLFNSISKYKNNVNNSAQGRGDCPNASSRIRHCLDHGWNDTKLHWEWWLREVKITLSFPATLINFYEYIIYDIQHLIFKLKSYEILPSQITFKSTLTQQKQRHNFTIFRIVWWKNNERYIDTKTLRQLHKKRHHIKIVTQFGKSIQSNFNAFFSRYCKSVPLTFTLFCDWFYIVRKCITCLKLVLN